MKLKYEVVHSPFGQGLKFPDSMCFSCSRVGCPGRDEVTKANAVTKCNSWLEQKFIARKADVERIKALVISFCYDQVSGKHNITQSNDGFDGMMDELMVGILYTLTHRKAFNALRNLGEEVLSGRRKH